VNEAPPISQTPARTIRIEGTTDQAGFSPRMNHAAKHVMAVQVFTRKPALDTEVPA
jgi:hypothetical protein